MDSIEQALKRFDEQISFKHYQCDDSWYSCPKSDEGSINDYVGDECICGVEEMQNIFKSFLKQELEAQEKRLRLDEGRMERPLCDWADKYLTCTMPVVTALNELVKVILKLQEQDKR